MSTIGFRNTTCNLEEDPSTIEEMIKRLSAQLKGVHISVRTIRQSSALLTSNWRRRAIRCQNRSPSSSAARLKNW